MILQFIHLSMQNAFTGPIGVNMATYVGFETAGIPGAVVATLGLICPSIIIILLIARVLKQFRESKTVDAIFYGLRPCSIALIAAAGLLVARVTFLNQDALAAGFNPAELLRWKELLLAAVLLVLTRFVKPLKKLHPVVFIALSAAVGILFAF